MKRGIYTRLALDGIKKNRKLYIPYLITSVLMVAVYCIMSSLGSSRIVSDIAGGGSLTDILAFGRFVIAAFSLLFLFYTDSFLIRRRGKEFGLYSVLGMNKKNIARILFSERCFTAGISLVLGMAAGVALSKLAELVLMRFIESEITYAFSFPLETLGETALFYGAIFLVIYLIDLIRIARSSAIGLVKSESAGEKPPKANWLIGILGFLLLGAAYWLSLAIKQPLEALFYFFVAVVVVIIATYLIFIAGSVVVCRLLQKNPRYYYSKKHFVSVSSMVYRMKRNGAGLASITILLTMVLVMISSSACLYFGRDAAMRSHYPRSISTSASRYGYHENDRLLADEMAKTADGVYTPDERIDDSFRTYYEYAIMGYFENSSVEMTLNSATDMAFITYNNVAEVHFLSLESYNRIQNTNETLEDGEAIVCAVKAENLADTITIAGVPYRVKKWVRHDDLSVTGATLSAVSANLFLIVNDIDKAAQTLTPYFDIDGTPLMYMRWFYQFDSPVSDERQHEIASEIGRRIEDMVYASPDGHLVVQGHSCPIHVRSASYAWQKTDFYGTFGGLFFVGILLSVIFLAATVLIIYYKQLSEGYEDIARFSIMRSIGMTRTDIRTSIDSQMLTVFLLPFLFSIAHFAFAFPFVNKILMLFGVFDIRLLTIISACGVLLSGGFYALVYRLTSNVYYRLVSGKR